MWEYFRKIILNTMSRVLETFSSNRVISTRRDMLSRQSPNQSERIKKTKNSRDHNSCEHVEEDESVKTEI